MGSRWCPRRPRHRVVHGNLRCAGRVSRFPVAVRAAGGIDAVNSRFWRLVLLRYLSPYSSASSAMRSRCGASISPLGTMICWIARPGVAGCRPSRAAGAGRWARCRSRAPPRTRCDRRLHDRGFRKRSAGTLDTQAMNDKLEPRVHRGCRSPWSRKSRPIARQTWAILSGGTNENSSWPETPASRAPRRSARESRVLGRRPSGGARDRGESNAVDRGLVQSPEHPEKVILNFRGRLSRSRLLVRDAAVVWA